MIMSNCLTDDLTEEQSNSKINYLPTIIMVCAIVDILDLITFGYLTKYVGK